MYGRKAFSWYIHMGCMGYGNGRGWVVMVVSSKLLRFGLSPCHELGIE